MKKENGVSMMELVIVIIILIIITTFSVFSGKEAVNQAEVTELYTEMNSIREALNGINIKKDMNENFEIKSGEHYDVKATEINPVEAEFEVLYDIEIKDGDFDKLYIIYGMDEMEKYELSNVRKSYNFESIKHTYLVNFEKAEVDLLKSIVIADKKVRTFEQVRALVDDGDI